MLPPVCLIGSDRGAEMIRSRLIALGFPVLAVGVPLSHAARHGATSRSPIDLLDDAARESEVVIITVGAVIRDDGSADESALWNVFSALARLHFQTWPTVVVAARVPVGTTGRLAAAMDWCDIVYAPNAFGEPLPVGGEADSTRIVVGCDAPGAALNYVRLLEPSQRPIFFTSRRNAELIAICGSAYRALDMSFSNEVARLCEALEADADDVLRGIGYGRPVRPNPLRPGIGFGTSPIGSELQSIVNLAGRVGAGRALFAATLEANDAQRKRIVELLAGEVRSLENVSVGIWGLASGDEDEDVADAVAMQIVTSLAERGARMMCYDPTVHLVDLPRGSALVTSALEAARADVLLVLAARPEFAHINPRSYADSIALRVVIDGCNVLDPERVGAAGLEYRGVGRPRATTFAHRQNASIR